MLKTSLIVLLLAGCAAAPERWLTAEEDAELRANCEPIPGHCVMVPYPLWEQIKAALQAAMGSRI